ADLFYAERLTETISCCELEDFANLIGFEWLNGEAFLRLFSTPFCNFDDISKRRRRAIPKALRRICEHRA
ncbi:hypothetical protein WDZ92_47775, partial [Nostoc sp. NIES-2111]